MLAKRKNKRENLVFYLFIPERRRAFSIGMHDIDTRITVRGVRAIYTYICVYVV